MLIPGCFQSGALIQAFGESCGLRPLADCMKTNIYADDIGYSVPTGSIRQNRPSAWWRPEVVEILALEQSGNPDVQSL